MDRVASKETVQEMAVLRAISILAVLMVHATSSAVSIKTGSSYLGLFSFLNSISLFCVPAFIFLTSFVLFYNYYEQPFTAKIIVNFFKKRFTYILIPYVMISLFYFVFRQVMVDRDRNMEDAALAFAWKLSNGTAYFHLYYVFIGIQLYLLFPFLLLLFQKRPLLAKWAIPIGFAVQWAFYAANRYIFLLSSKGSVSLTYFVPFLLGAFVGIYFDKMKGWLILDRNHWQTGKGFASIALWVVWLGSAAGFSGMWYVTRVTGKWYESVWYEAGYNVFTFSSILVMTQISFLVLKWVSPAFQKLIFDLASLSFGIYLIHPFFLMIYKLYPPDFNPLWEYPVWVAGGYGVSLGCSLLVLLAAYRSVKGAWILFGKVPAKFHGQH